MALYHSGNAFMEVYSVPGISRMFWIFFSLNAVTTFWTVVAHVVMTVEGEGEKARLMLVSM
jgi:hypothetical protein